MQNRMALQDLLESILGSKHVYFQPPGKEKMSYPCIVYHLDNITPSYANNIPYTLIPRYQVTVIDKNPESLIPDKIARLPLCIFERRYAADNLNHTVFNLYYKRRN